MASISFDGFALNPEVIIPRKTAGSDLIFTSLTSETVRSQQHGFVDMQLFASWPETIFVPEPLQ
jgi:hypothetical protein